MTQPSADTTPAGSVLKPNGHAAHYELHQAGYDGGLCVRVFSILIEGEAHDEARLKMSISDAAFSVDVCVPPERAEQLAEALLAGAAVVRQIHALPPVLATAEQGGAQ